MATKLVLLLVCANIALALGGGGDDRWFIRKYAMMKVYESCFGQEVVKQVRMEVRAACAKCRGVGELTHATEKPTTPPPEESSATPLSLANLAKLQSVFGIRPVSPFAAPQYRPYGAAAASYGSVPNYQQFPVYYQQQPNPYASSMFYQPSPAFYPQYYGGPQRASRDLDIRGQLETLKSRLDGKVRNITCIMQELGYMDHNLEPNFRAISERVNRLPVGDDLKKDVLEGIEYCRQFSQCVPETKHGKFQMSNELVKPMFFFKCYKQKKLEACVMKDVRERYADGMTDDDMLPGGEGRAMPGNSEDMETAMYEFLHAGDDDTFDSLF